MTPFVSDKNRGMVFVNSSTQTLYLTNRVKLQLKVMQYNSKILE